MNVMKPQTHRAAVCTFIALAVLPTWALADHDCRQFMRSLNRDCMNAASDSDDRQACAAAYAQNLDRCSDGDREAAQLDQQRQRANAGYTTDIGPFISIPQRQTYILPGMR